MYTLKFVHPQSDAYYTDAYYLTESQHINSNLDGLLFFFTDYERKYIYDAIQNIISVTINI